MDDSDFYYGRSAASELCRRYEIVRAATEALAAELSPEDQCVQSMPDASPAKWHRAHTTWFFEQFVLIPNEREYEVYDPAFSFLFNSYYEAIGPRHPRPSRGLLTRPSARQVTEYRQHVDAAMRRAIPGMSSEVASVIELGLHHEQQHQELLVTDMLHAFAAHPLFPAMIRDWQESVAVDCAATFVAFEGGVHLVGNDAGCFAFDNETPRHQVLLQPYAIASRLVRNQDWLEFIEDAGYQMPSLWMSDGWSALQESGWSAPLHWRNIDGDWFQMGPGGLSPLRGNAPVRHVSWYEADAFARWSGARLPTEFEWEVGEAHPLIAETSGFVWQWTESANRPYPGYQPLAGAIGEYNGKFMINQMVLRGSSMVTPPGHARPTYRNFFHPDKRWQFSGLRLAKDL